MKILITLFCLFCIISCNDVNNNINQVSISKQQSHEFIKAVHYFSSASPGTFWEEFEGGNVNNDLQQIKLDGFNSIILVVPWTGFETQFQNKQTTSNEKLYKRIDFILNKIKENGLDYILRVGYPHNFSPNINVNAVELCTNFYTKIETQIKWLDFLNNLKKITDKYPDNLFGVLVSWEDFWCPHIIFPHLDEAKRTKLAKDMGYSQWLIQNFANDEKSADKSNIPLPKKNDLGYFHYIKFIDDKFDNLVLKTTKKIFPQTAMEVRTDKDLAKDANNENIWVGHNLHFSETGHRGTYWAPFWGAENEGEKLSLKKALFNFEYFLNYVTDNGKHTKHIIDQFNFTDNAPYLPNNAVLIESEIPDFLLKSVPLLKKYSSGYGLWAYRDYANNVLYNSSFELGLDGWQTQGKLEIVGNSGDKQLHMSTNSSISQIYDPNHRHTQISSYKHLNLCVTSAKIGNIEIYTNNQHIKTVTLNSGNNCIKLNIQNFQNVPLVDFKLVAKSELVVDEIKLYGFVQRLKIYNEYNQESDYIEPTRRLNELL